MKVDPDALYDILSTGLKLPYSTRPNATWTEQTTKDALELIKNQPKSVGYKDGHLRCRDECTPFLIACLNCENVPKEVILAILQSDPSVVNSKILVSDRPRYVLVDAYKNNEDSFKQKVWPIVEPFDATMDAELIQKLTELKVF